MLFFPAAGQTCHAYCTYCFRWAQFIGDSDLRFAQKDAGSLFTYLDEHPEVTDTLRTTHAHAPRPQSHHVQYHSLHTLLPTPHTPHPTPLGLQVSDILFTGGDPMFMKTRLIKEYFEPFKDPDFLPHIKNLRIGTRALTFWPQRFTSDDDADELHKCLREVKEVGGRHVAVMAHLSHVRELQTEKVRAAIKP